MAKITVCDKCGERVREGYTATLQIYATDSLFPLAITNKSIDLCATCRNALLEYLKSYEEKQNNE